MKHRFAPLAGGRSPLRLPLSPVRAQMALSALEAWQPPEQPGKRGWYRIANSGDGPAQVNIFDEISWFGVTAEAFCSDLAGVTGPVEVHINSPGGDAFDGITIYNALRARGDVTTVVDGLAASAASIIAMAGTERVASPGSMMMIHDALAMTVGNAADHAETARLLDKVSDNIASVYEAATGKPAASWRDTMRDEGWYTAAEAVGSGLMTSLGQPGGEDGADQDAGWDTSVFAAWQAARPAGKPEKAKNKKRKTAPAGGPGAGIEAHAETDWFRGLLEGEK